MTTPDTKAKKKKILRAKPEKGQSFTQAQSEVVKKYSTVFAKLAK